jgi:heptosyltransferase-2
MDTPKRLLVRAPNWLGDAVMALPAMAAVRAAHRDSTLTIAAIPSIAPLFDELTIAAPDAVLRIPDKRAEASVLRAGQFDAAVLLPNSFRTAWSCRRAGIPERWGFASSGRRFLLTRAVARPRGQIHQTDYYLELARGLGADPSDAIPRVAVRPATLARAEAVLAAAGVAPGTALVGFAPGAAYGHAKRWPPRRVAETIVRITGECQAQAILVGARGDGDSGREIESSLPASVRAVNLIGRTDLGQLAGILSRCAAFVSNDSGAMHLAAALGTSVIAIFGPTNERATAPRGGPPRSGSRADDLIPPDVLIHPVFCRPCMLRDCPIDHRCMKGVTVDLVVSTISRRLAESEASS